MSYRADAIQLEAGSIVKVAKPANSSGKPTYPHFFIVLAVPAPLKIGDLIPSLCRYMHFAEVARCMAYRRKALT